MLLTVDLERLNVGPGLRLLDVGCGEGRHSFGALARGAFVAALDMDLASMKPHRRRLSSALAERRSGGGFVRGDAFSLPFNDEAFDRVICAEVMEHVHDYRAAARELARVTRPGGLLAVTVPTPISEHAYLRLGDDYFESPGGHIRIFKPRVLAEGLAAAGLRTLGCGFAHGLHTPYWMLRCLVGLPRADQFRLVRIARLMLVRAVAMPFMNALERGLLNFICPKSVIIYAEKPAR